MTAANSLAELREATKGIVQFDHGSVKVLDKNRLRDQAMDKLAWTVAFSTNDEARNAAVWIIRQLAWAAGNGPASINDVYLARGAGKLPATFTVPAINIRALAYDFARAIFRAARKMGASAILCELSRSEMGYTAQTPYEYASSILAAALREEYPYPVFIQGDHFQINAADYKKDSAKQIAGLKKAISDAMDAGFLNIDIDTSTLVDLSKPDLPSQQALNCSECAVLTEYTREHTPAGVTISLGGEIGEVGGKNSTVEELDAFMGGYNKLLKKGTLGLSKISVQTGTAHGGVVMPDGTMAKVKVDFDTLAKLSAASRKNFGMAGAVQHGASTLPLELFDKFPQSQACEIHLATEFQNIVYDHPAFPADLKKEIYAWLDKNCANERKSTDSDQQFYYKTRKKAIGPYKKTMWDFPNDVKYPIVAKLEERVTYLFEKLNIKGTGATIQPHVKMAKPPAATGAVKAAAEHFEGDD